MLLILFLLLMATCLMVFVATPITADRKEAMIWTDKEDYASNETVIIYGSGFNPETTVSITLTRPDGHSDIWTLISSSSGLFTTTYLLNGILGVYTIAATDGTNTASTTFTDAKPTFSITIDKINGYSPPYPILLNPIHLEGSASSTNFPGLLSQYQVQVDWGDGTVDTDSNVDFVASPDGKDFSGTWSSNPDHTYTDYRTWTITVKLYHQQPPGAESGDAQTQVTITVIARITITTSPEGLSIIADGNTYTAPKGFDWDAGSTHSIGTTSPQYGPIGVQSIWQSWSDGDAITHNIIVPITPTTYTAYFKTLYYLTVQTDPLGIVTIPGEGWYDEGTYVTLAAPSVTGYRFDEWKVDGVSQRAGVRTIEVHMNAPHTATAYYSQLPNTADVTFDQVGVDADFTGTVLTVDGTNYGVADLPKTFTWTIGSEHTFTYHSPLVVSVNAKQYVWTHTLGLSTAQSETITVPSGGGAVTGHYKTQYYLTVTSPYGVKNGEGWYDTGATAYAGVNIGIVDHGNGTRRVFTNWRGDASGTNYAQSNPITMNAPKTAVANWKTQYYFEVSSAHGSPTPTTGWYDAGTSITASVTSPVSGSAGTRYVCTGWSGTGSVPVSGTDTTVIFTLNQSSSITWNWKTQYYLTLVTDPPGVTVPSGEGWHDADAIVSISTPQYVVTDSSRYRFNGWTTSDMTEITDPSASSTTVLMDKAKTVTANYGIQYLVTFNHTGLDGSAIGTVVTVDGSAKTLSDLPFTVWVDDGTSVSYSYETTVSSSVSGKRFKLESVTGPASPITVTAPVTVIGNYKLQYQVTFTQTGLDDTATGTVVTIDSVTKNKADLSFTDWFDSGTTYSYSSIVSSTVTDKRFRLESTSGIVSPITSSGTVTGNYTPQYRVTFTQSGLDNTATGTVVTVAGDPKTYGDLPFTTDWLDHDSSLAFAFSNPVASSISGKRFALVSVSHTSPLTVTAPTTVTGNYKTQYYLTVNTNPVEVLTLNPAAVSGQGWYDSGSTATVDAVQNVEKVVSESRYDFRSWTGATPTGTDNEAEVYMDGPKTATANYQLQYKIVFDQSEAGTDFTGTTVMIDTANYGVADLPKELWWDEGSTHNFAFQSPLAIGTNKQYVWVSTTGLSTLQSDPSFTVTASGSMTGNYKTQWLQTFDASANVKSDGTGTIVTVNGVPVSGGSLPYTLWVDDGLTVTYSYETTVSSSITGKRYWLNSVSGPSSGYAVSSANTIIGNYVTQYYLTVTSPYNAPTPASGWFDSGTIISSSVISPWPPGATDTRYVCTGWTGTGSVPSSGTATAVTFTINAPSSITWNWKTQYLVSFTQTGSAVSPTVDYQIDSGSTITGTVPFTVWVDAGSKISYTYTATVLGDTGVRYVRTGVNPASPQTVNAPLTITGAYKTQYYLSMFTNYGTVSPSSGWYDAGSVVAVSATAPSVIAGERYVWLGWTGTGTISYTGMDNPAQVTMNSPVTETAVWRHEYRLIVLSAYGSPIPEAGEHWYEAEASITASVISPWPLYAADTRYVCTGWIGTGSVYASGTATSVSFTINQPSTITWNWTTQHYLKVISPYGTPGGMGWYDEGTTAYATLDYGIENIAQMVRAVFTGWNGDASGIDLTSNPIIMDAPKTATANYQLQYYLTLATSPIGVTTPSGEGWYDADTYANISTAEYVDMVAGSSRYRFNGWTTDDMAEIADPSVYSTKVLMDKAKMVTANYANQYYLTVRVEPAGITTIPGEGWYDEGTHVTLTAPMYLPVAEEVRFRFDHWKVDAAIVTGNPITVHMDAPHTATAHYISQYLVTFEQAGLDALAIGTVVTVDGSAKTLSDLPFTVWVDNGALVNYSYEVIISSGTSGKRFRLDSVIGPGSPITVTETTVVTGNYVTQYQIIFDQFGVGLDFAGTVVVIDETDFGVGDLPKVFWWDRDSVLSFAYDSPLLVDAGKRYVWSSTTGLSTLQSSTLIITGPGGVTGNYRAMYYLDVVSQYGDLYGSGWYSLNSEARFGVTTPVDHGNKTIRVFIRWSGDANISEPEGTIIMMRPSTVIASWETQYLVTFNTTLPNRVVLRIPRVPEILPPGMEVFGMYYPALDLVAVGPAPNIVLGGEGTRYVLKGWTLDGKMFTLEANVSFVVEGPHEVAVVYDVEHLLVINAVGVNDSFTAAVTIATSTPIVRDLKPTSPIQEWLKQGVHVALTISTPNKIGHGEWAIFKEWLGQLQGRNRTVSFVMFAPNTVNAVFFKVNPVAESIPYSILAGLISMFLCILIVRRKKAEGRKNLRSVTSGIMVSAAALIVAIIVSACIAIGYGINVNELLDFTNWAVVFLALEALVFMFASIAITRKIQRRK